AGLPRRGHRAARPRRRARRRGGEVSARPEARTRGRLRAGARDTFRSMGHRNFRLFFSGQVVSQAGNWLTRVGLTLLVLKLTHNGVAVGFIAACEFVPMLFLGAWAGVVADRSDKRR